MEVWSLQVPLCKYRTCVPLVCPQPATSAPLIERSIERATGIVYNITGGKDLTLQVGDALG